MALAHNHPSGNLTPSQADIDLTRKIKEADKLLEIQVLDHIILTSEKYYLLPTKASYKRRRGCSIGRSNQMHPVNLQRLRQRTIPPLKKYLHPSDIPLRSIYGRVVYFFNGAPWFFVFAFVIQIPGCMWFFYNDSLLIFRNLEMRMILFLKKFASIDTCFAIANFLTICIVLVNHSQHQSKYPNTLQGAGDH